MAAVNSFGEKEIRWVSLHFLTYSYAHPGTKLESANQLDPQRDSTRRDFKVGLRRTRTSAVNPRSSLGSLYVIMSPTQSDRRRLMHLDAGPLLRAGKSGLGTEACPGNKFKAQVEYFS